MVCKSVDHGNMLSICLMQLLRRFTGELDGHSARSDAHVLLFVRPQFFHMSHRMCRNFAPNVSVYISQLAGILVSKKLLYFSEICVTGYVILVCTLIEHELSTNK